MVDSFPGAVVDPTKARKRHCQVYTCVLRQHIRKAYKNDVFTWISDQIHVPKWFIEPLMPLKSSASIPKDIENLYKVVKSSSHQLEITKILAANREEILDGKTSEFLKNLEALCCSYDERKEKCLAIFSCDYISNIYKELEKHADVHFTMGVFNRCKELKRANKISWIATGKLNDCVAYVLHGFTMPHLSPDDAINELAVRLNLGDYYTRIILDPPMESIDSVIEQVIEAHKREQEYAECHITASIDWDGYISGLDDDITGYDLEDVRDYIDMQKHEVLECISNPEDWRFWFDNFHMLKQALEQNLLELRDDSYVCKCFITYGEYVGPSFGENVEMIESIVLLMAEMKFMFTKTDYENISSIIKPSDNAKVLALYEYLLNNPTVDTSTVPQRVHRLMLSTKNIQDELDKAKQKLDSRSYYVYESDSEYDSDSYSS